MTSVGPYPRGLLDTSVVIQLERITDQASLPERPQTSAITLAELTVGPLVTDDPSEQAARQRHVQLVESSFDPLPFDAAAARAFGQVAASLRPAGRKRSARAYDAMIAAIAIAHDLPVFTTNPADFTDIDGLSVVDVRVANTAA